MMIPWEVTIIPNYLTIKAWGWMDSYQGLIVPFMAGAFGVFFAPVFCDSRVSCLMRPKSTGAVISAVICPWCAAVPVFHCHLGGVYLPYALESLLWPLLITNQASMRTVQIGVAMLADAEVMSWNLILAGVTIVFAPFLCLCWLLALNNWCAESPLAR